MQTGAFWSRFGALSPSFEWDAQRLVADFRDGPVSPGRFYFDGEQSGGAPSDARAMMAAALLARGYDARYAEYEGGTHSEGAWAARVGPMLKWLFPPLP